MSLMDELNTANRAMLNDTAMPNTMITPAKASIRRAPTELRKFMSISNIPFVQESASRCTAAAEARRRKFAINPVSLFGWPSADAARVDGIYPEHVRLPG